MIYVKLYVSVSEFLLDLKQYSYNTESLWIELKHQ